VCCQIDLNIGPGTWIGRTIDQVLIVTRTEAKLDSYIVVFRSDYLLAQLKVYTDDKENIYPGKLGIWEKRRT
jgi:hypothetical protein